MSALLPHKLVIFSPKLEKSIELFWWRKILAGSCEVSKKCTKENGEVSVRQTEGKKSQILTTNCSNLSGIWSSSSGYKQRSVLNHSRTVRIIRDCGDKWYTDLYRSLHSGSYWQWTKSSIHQNQFRANVASSVYSFTFLYWTTLSLRSSLFWYVTERRLVVTDVSVQPIGPIFKGQAWHTLDDGIDGVSRNVGNQLPFYTA
jgi:hypothetical protein